MLARAKAKKKKKLRHKFCFFIHCLPPRAGFARFFSVFLFCPPFYFYHVCGMFSMFSHFGYSTLLHCVLVANITTCYIHAHNMPSSKWNPQTLPRFCHTLHRRRRATLLKVADKSETFLFFFIFHISLLLFFFFCCF